MVGHNPTLKTLVMIENTIMHSETHPTRMELYRSLPRKIEYQTYKTALEYLEAHNMIIFNTDKIVYTGGKNEKLQKLIKNRITI
jgi:hypothetical protein